MRRVRAAKIKGGVGYGHGMLDWLTITTPAKEFYDDCMLFVMTHEVISGEPMSDTRRENYRGKICDGVFVGSGVQGGKDDYMVSVSGVRADDFFFAFQETIGNYISIGKEIRCSRIDLQLTENESEPHLFDDMGLELLAASKGKDVSIGYWRGKGRVPNVEVYISKKGSTIGIGNRMSERYVRIYQKQEIGMIRFEIEFHGKLAKAMLHELATSKGDVRGRVVKVLAGELDRYPVGFAAWLRGMFDFEDGERVASVLVSDDLERTFNWFERSVLPAMYNLLLSDLYRRKIVRMFLALIKATMIERLCNEKEKYRL